MAPTTPKKSAPVADAYLENFRHFEREAPQPAWMLPLRQGGFARFTELGFPTLQHEDWRFTNVAPIAKLPFKPALAAPADGLAAEALKHFPFASLPGPRLVFVNGHYAAALSRIGRLPAGVKVANVAAVLAREPALLEPHLVPSSSAGDNAFTALNQAFFLDGGFIHLPAGTVVPEPVQLIYIATANQSGATMQPRNVIVAEANSQLTVIESYVTAGGAGYFTNAVTELVVGDHARVEVLKFQDEAADAFHMAAMHGRFGRASNVSVHSFALGAKISRNSIRTNLAGEGLECVLNGLYLTRGEQLADHHMVVEHAQPHCASHEYFNGILDDKSRGVFHGRILVQQLAQKTDAKQTNKNLLLSDDATANTKPQLEIYADDVKCTHGATIGQLNPESIFYLRSRGIGPDTARRMLIHAFAGEIIERIRHEAAREELNQLVWERLEANPHLAEK
ncbi:MAG: Fe-S cluster assembly protein SufD [Verrucomicrobia subdivision 3 bacterium]|nr:Fe-S cluster assembly protein SufD [Verrucomicrobiota bacterium]MCC6819549.1 Fe-S cluster assembly protein SufD [Limisphaerales bacterium]